jgi:phosphatidylserine/phosphatidylglycerophosphate/cardiolipin synthase-like enzyme
MENRTTAKNKRLSGPLSTAAFRLLAFVAPARATQIRACFSPPPGGRDPLATVVQTIDGARKTVLVQMYALTSRQIVSALVSAKHRGVDVRAIVDRSQLDEDHSDAYAAGRLASGGVPVGDPRSGACGRIHAEPGYPRGAITAPECFGVRWIGATANVRRRR